MSRNEGGVQSALNASHALLDVASLGRSWLFGGLILEGAGIYSRARVARSAIVEGNGP
jgi:hypothetical protein